jgi:hypothetical protein
LHEILAGIFVGIFIIVAEILQEFFAVIADILGLLRILCSAYLSRLPFNRSLDAKLKFKPSGAYRSAKALFGAV